MSSAGESSHSISSSVSMTKLGLQLGILNALSSKLKSSVPENKKKRHKKKMTSKTGESAISKHDLRMVEVNANLTCLNSRLSVFDSMLASSQQSYPANSSITPRSQSPPLFGSTPSSLSPCRRDHIARAALLRVSSPRRSRYQEVLYSDPYTGCMSVSASASASGPASVGGSGKRRTLRMRVDYWADDELHRLSMYSDCNPVPYGRQPAYVELLVPETASPQELLAAVLDAWEWDHSHSFRFSGPAKPGSTSTLSPNAKLGGKCKVYEGVAFARDTLTPSMREFDLFRGCISTLQYDLLGDAWSWLCTCIDVYEFSVADDVEVQPQVAVRLVGLVGDIPLQYLWQFEKKFSVDGSFEYKGSGTELEVSNLDFFRARYTSRRSLETKDELQQQYRLEAERLRQGGVFFNS